MRNFKRLTLTLTLYISLAGHRPVSGSRCGHTWYVSGHPKTWRDRRDNF